MNYARLYEPQRHEEHKACPERNDVLSLPKGRRETS